MRTVGRLFWASLLAIAVSGGCGHGPDREPDAGLKTEISMEEAIAMGADEARTRDEGLRLTRIHSYDNDSIRSAAAGADGRRQWWVVRFGGEDGRRMDAILCDGAVVAVETADADRCDAPIDMARVKLTAAEAVAAAAKLGLRGGNPACEDEWVSGYNFRLSSTASEECRRQEDRPRSDRDLAGGKSRVHGFRCGDGRAALGRGKDRTMRRRGTMGRFPIGRPVSRSAME